MTGDCCIPGLCWNAKNKKAENQTHARWRVLLSQILLMIRILLWLITHLSYVVVFSATKFLMIELAISKRVLVSRKTRRVNTSVWVNGTTLLFVDVLIWTSSSNVANRAWRYQRLEYTAADVNSSE